MRDVLKPFDNRVWRRMRTTHFSARCNRKSCRRGSIEIMSGELGIAV